MNFLERIKSIYVKWKEEAPQREKARELKDGKMIEKVKRMAELEKQKAELMKHKAESEKHIAQVRKHSQEFVPKSSGFGGESFITFQPSSYFAKSKGGDK